MIGLLNLVLFQCVISDSSFAKVIPSPQIESYTSHDTLYINLEVQFMNNDTSVFKYYYFQNPYNLSVLKSEKNISLHYNLGRTSDYFRFTKKEEKALSLLWLNTIWPFAGSDRPIGALDSVIIFPGCNLNVSRRESYILSKNFCDQTILFTYDMYLFKDSANFQTLFKYYTPKATDFREFNLYQIALSLKINCNEFEEYELIKQVVLTEIDQE